MEDAEKTELRGRVHLWSAALGHCIMLLSSAKRAAASMPNAPIATAEPASKEPTPFGSQLDLAMAYIGNCALSAILLCQVFNAGYRAPASAASNHEKRVVRERDDIVARAFPAPVLRAKFDALWEKVSAARDGMIAHADGAAMGVVHDDGFVFSDSFLRVIAEIDLDEFMQMVVSLYSAINDRMRELDGERSVGATLQKVFAATPGRIPDPEQIKEAMVPYLRAMARHQARFKKP